MILPDATAELLISIPAWFACVQFVQGVAGSGRRNLYRAQLPCPVEIITHLMPFAISHLFERRPSASRVSWTTERSTISRDCKRSKRPVWLALALSGGHLKLELQIRGWEFVFVFVHLFWLCGLFVCVTRHAEPWENAEGRRLLGAAADAPAVEEDPHHGGRHLQVGCHHAS